MKNLKQHMLDSVLEFRETSGLSVDNGIKADHGLHHKLFQEEFFEYLTAKDKSQKADALADMAIVWSGYALDASEDYMVPFEPVEGVKGYQECSENNYFENRDYNTVIDILDVFAQDQGINIRKAFDIAHKSNMTKFTKDFAVLTESIDWYAAKGIETTYKKTGEFYALFSAKDQSDGEKDYPKGKLLKCTCFVEPDWTNEKEWRA